MNREIEAKFLLHRDGQDYRAPEVVPELGDVQEIRAHVQREGKVVRQGYFPEESFSRVLSELSSRPPFHPREVRLRDYDGEPCLTAKGSGRLVRDEFEIPVAREFFERWWKETEGRRVAKRRWRTKIGELLLEIDDYIDRDLLIAEITLPDEQAYRSLPRIGKDVTDDDAFKNRNLAQ